MVAPVVAPGVVLTRETRTPPWRGVGSALADAAAFVVATVALVVTVAVAPQWYLLAAVVVLAAEALLAVRPDLTSWAAELGHAGAFWRSAVRGGTAVALVARASGAPGRALVWAAGTWVVLLLAGVGARVGIELVAFLRRSPVLTRNVDLTPLQLPAPPPRFVTGRNAVATALLDVPLVVGAGAAVAAGTGWPVVAGAVASLGVAAAVAGTLATTTLRLRRHNPRTLVPRHVQAVLDDRRPEVLLYFAGRPSTLYQVQMWLEVAERLARSTLVVLRDRESLLALDPTSLPVLCVPQASMFAALELPSAKVVLLPANAAENIHVLRRPGLRSAFIGHGDSDKAYSANPFVRAYDEVWVAGPAGRDRFVEAGVALAPSAVVEVGRPQVALVRPRHRTDPTFTVLYAPTWEGWGDVAFHTSLPQVGEALVRLLLARPGARVIYRPHPLTGTRDGATRAAHRRVVALLEQAGARRTSSFDRAASGGAAPGAPGSTVSAARRASDPLAHAVEHSRPDVDRDALATAEVVRERAYWDGVPPGTHHLVDDGWPDVRSCFAQADLLVTDVSSLISDWLVTDRPYAVVNSSQEPAWEFAARYPSARGGRLVGPDLAGLGTLLDDLAAGTDPDAAARAAERTRLLGARPEAAMELFADAVDRLCARAGAPAPLAPDAGPEEDDEPEEDADPEATRTRTVRQDP